MKNYRPESYAPMKPHLLSAAIALPWEDAEALKSARQAMAQPLRKFCSSPRSRSGTPVLEVRMLRPTDRPTLGLLANQSVVVFHTYLLDERAVDFPAGMDADRFALHLAHQALDALRAEFPAALGAVGIESNKGALSVLLGCEGRTLALQLASSDLLNAPQISHLQSVRLPLSGIAAAPLQFLGDAFPQVRENRLSLAVHSPTNGLRIPRNRL